jgi:hypothetical protein
MRIFSSMMIVAILFYPFEVVRASDPCPGRQSDLKNATDTARIAWLKLDSDVSGLKFDRTKFTTQLRAALEQSAVKDIQDSIAAVNATQPPTKQLHISDANLQVAAKKKVNLLFARPDMKTYVAKLTNDAEDAFIDAKAKKQVELANAKKQMDDQLIAEKAKLDGNCSYDFPSQFVRIIAQALQIDIRVDGGMVKFGEFQTLIPEFNDGKVMLGNQRLMDFPVVKGGQVSIGGTSVGVTPMILSGGVVLPATAILQALHIDVPKIDIPINIGNGNNGHGLNMQIGNWKF